MHSFTILSTLRNELNCQNYEAVMSEIDRTLGQGLIPRLEPNNYQVISKELKWLLESLIALILVRQKVAN